MLDNVFCYRTITYKLAMNYVMTLVGDGRVARGKAAITIPMHLIKRACKYNILKLW